MEAHGGVVLRLACVSQPKNEAKCNAFFGDNDRQGPDR